MYKGQDITNSQTVTSKKWYKDTDVISSQNSIDIYRSDIGSTFKFEAVINSTIYN